MDGEQPDPILANLVTKLWSIQDEAAKLKRQSDERLAQIAARQMKEVELERAMTGDSLRALYSRAIAMEKELRAMSKTPLPERPK